MLHKEAERTDVDIGELEALIRRCKQAGDPESRWIQGLLEDALRAKRYRKARPEPRVAAAGMSQRTNSLTTD